MWLLTWVFVKEGWARKEGRNMQAKPRCELEEEWIWWGSEGDVTWEANAHGALKLLLLRFFLSFFFLFIFSF